MTAAGIIAALGMARHPEGGWYVETFRDNAAGHGKEAGGRGHSTAIYFLLERGEVSAWHRVKDAAEVWHFHAGAPLELSICEEGGSVESCLARHRPRRGRAAADRRSGRLVADGAQPGRLDAGRLHRGAGFRLRSVRTGGAWLAAGRQLTQAGCLAVFLENNMDLAASTAPAVMSTQAAKMRSDGSATPAATRTSVESSGAA